MGLRLLRLARHQPTSVGAKEARHQSNLTGVNEMILSETESLDLLYPPEHSELRGNEALRQTMSDANLSASQVAEICGVNRRQVYNWLNGKSAVPQLAMQAVKAAAAQSASSRISKKLAQIKELEKALELEKTALQRILKKFHNLLNV